MARHCCSRAYVDWWNRWILFLIMLISPNLTNKVCGILTAYTAANLKNNSDLLNARNLMPFITSMISLSLATNLLTTCEPFAPIKRVLFKLMRYMQRSLSGRSGPLRGPSNIERASQKEPIWREWSIFLSNQDSCIPYRSLFYSVYILLPTTGNLVYPTLYVIIPHSFRNSHLHDHTAFKVVQIIVSCMSDLSSWVC